ncbi:MAG TPA: LytR C-terminal domain-containing protein [Acidimicrobiales bacterium]|nr:LytR C-terminal domain-containing protein [Acidimicrobiales bacterium]
MARPPGGSVHIGKAAVLIVVALVLGMIVLRDNSFGGGAGSVSADDIREAIEDFTVTTLAADNDSNDDKASSTTTAVPALHAKNSVKVIAINATGTAGVAGRATSKLQQAGYNALQPGNAPQKATTSLVYVVTPGYELDAQEIAALFGLPDSAVRALPTPSPSADIKPDQHIAVLVGPGITL